MLDLIRHRAQSWGVKIIFGIIILVFVFWGVGGGNQTVSNVAALVNDKPISAVDFYTAVKRQEEEIRAMYPEMTQDDMATLGLSRQVMNSMVARYAFQQDAERLGLGVTEQQLQHVILNNPAFMRNGTFDRALYEQLMGGRGRSTVQAERELATDILQDKLRGYIAMAVTITPDEAQRAHAFQAERRSASYVLFATEDYMDEVTPSEEEIQSFYDGNAQRFSHPDRTSLSYIDVTPAALADTVDVPEAEVEEAFAKGPSRFHLSQVAYMLPENASDADKQAALGVLQDIAELIRGGQDLAVAIAEMSERYPAIQGGDAGWVALSQVPPELEGRIKNLQKGELTEPIASPTGYVFFRLEGTDPDQDLPVALIKADIRKMLAEEHALLAFHETQERVVEAIDLRKSLEDIADDLDLRVMELPSQPRLGIPATLGLKRSVSPTLFEAPEGTLIANIMETESGFIVARIGTQQPAGPIPLDDVRTEIVEEVKRIEASRLAEQAANEALKGFEGDRTPPEFADRVVVSDTFTRDGNVEDFGPAPALGVAVFDHAPGTWIPRTFAVAKGVVIARTNEIISVSEDDWEEQKDGIIQAMLQAKQNALFSIYLEALDKSTTVSIPDPSIFERF